METQGASSLVTKEEAVWGSPVAAGYLAYVVVAAFETVFHLVKAIQSGFLRL